MSDIYTNGQNFWKTTTSTKTTQAFAPAPEASSARTDEELREISAPSVSAAPILTPESQQTISEMAVEANWQNALKKAKFIEFSTNFIKSHGSEALKDVLIRHSTSNGEDILQKLNDLRVLIPALDKFVIDKLSSGELSSSVFDCLELIKAQYNNQILQSNTEGERIWFLRLCLDLIQEKTPKEANSKSDVACENRRLFNAKLGEQASNEIIDAINKLPKFKKT